MSEFPNVKEVKEHFISKLFLGKRTLWRIFWRQKRRACNGEEEGVLNAQLTTCIFPTNSSLWRHDLNFSKITDWSGTTDSLFLHISFNHFFEKPK